MFLVDIGACISCLVMMAVPVLGTRLTHTAAVARRASPSGPASGPHTPSAARVASGVPPARPAATPAPASTLRGSAEAITLATPHSGAPSPLPSGVWGAGIRRATVSPASAAVVGGSMW